MLRLPSASDLGTGLPLQLQSDHTNRWASFPTSRVRKSIGNASHNQERSSEWRPAEDETSAPTLEFIGGIPVQKLASAFLYISHTSGYFKGNMQNLCGFSARIGSAESLAIKEGMVVLLKTAIESHKSLRNEQAAKLFFPLEKLECYTTWLLQNNLICNFHWNYYKNLSWPGHCDYKRSRF